MKIPIDMDGEVKTQSKSGTCHFVKVFNYLIRRNKMALITDYEKAKKLGLTDIKRWELGIEHHWKSDRLMNFLKEHDFNDYDDHFCWKTGGDGDNGETLMYQLDAFFDLLEYTENA